MAAFLWIAMIVAFFTGVSEGIKEASAVKPEIGTAEQYLALVNKERAEVGAAPLTIDPVLNNTAKIKADDMVVNNYFDHNAPNGTDWSVILRMNGKPTEAIGENLSECNQTPESTIEAWVASKTHYAGMINTKYTKYGSYSEIRPSDGCLMVVNHFSS